MKKSVLFMIFLVVIGVLGIAGTGFATYYAVLYINREQNHRFEAAYIYDTSFSKTIDVDLGVIYPEEEKEQEFTIKSLIVRDIEVTMYFDGEQTSLGEHLYVRYMDEENATLLNDLVESHDLFTTRLSQDEEKTIKFTYYIGDEYVEPKREDVYFSLNIKAREISVYEGSRN